MGRRETDQRWAKPSKIWNSLVPVGQRTNRCALASMAQRATRNRHEAECRWTKAFPRRGGRESASGEKPKTGEIPLWCCSYQFLAEHFELTKNFQVAFFLPKAGRRRTSIPWEEPIFTTHGGNQFDPVKLRPIVPPRRNLAGFGKTRKTRRRRRFLNAAFAASHFWLFAFRKEIYSCFSARATTIGHKFGVVPPFCLINTGLAKATATAVSLLETKHSSLLGRFQLCGKPQN